MAFERKVVTVNVRGRDMEFFKNIEQYEIGSDMFGLLWTSALSVPAVVPNSFLNSFMTDASYLMRVWKSGSRVESMLSSTSMSLTKMLRS